VYRRVPSGVAVVLVYEYSIDQLDWFAFAQNPRIDHSMKLVNRQAFDPRPSYGDDLC
jgi:hypothetical protein